MKCRCGGDTKVIDTASSDPPNTIGMTYRIRKCQYCGLIFPTFENVHWFIKGCETEEECLQWTKGYINKLKARRQYK